MDRIDALTTVELREIVRRISEILHLETDEQWTSETIEDVANVLVQYGLGRTPRSGKE
jgi:hypothetical protein